ncbi:YciI family protein [Streptomyces sp. NPDC048417]|uniref:YciI family protein n=1 Tax=Streptomyces sp. NPDC048417 TaxID=3155387 RepID=UPI003425963C
MEFFCYHRDRADSLALRRELVEEHWSYMDRYETELIARGPAFGAGGETLTGSVHIVGLPDPAAARAFAFDEPNYQAGVYRDVLLRRWRNLLGRTMWEFPGGRAGGSRYLVLGLGPVHTEAEPEADVDLSPGPGTGPGTDLGLPPGIDRDELIAFGPLLSDDATAWLGTAALVRAPDPDRARAVLAPHRYAETEVYEWEFGGRR